MFYFIFYYRNTKGLVYCWVMLKHENFIKQCHLINYEVAISKLSFETVSYLKKHQVPIVIII